MKTRCPWPGDDPLYVAYHDTEWGVPVRDDRIHFEFLVLEAAQAGHSRNEITAWMFLAICLRRVNYWR